MTHTQGNFYETFELLRKYCSNKLYLKMTESGEKIIRSDIKDSSEASAFVEAFEFITRSRFVSFKMGPYVRKQFTKVWSCYHYEHKKKGVNSAHHCPAKIRISIKRNTRSTRYNDSFLKMKPPLPAVIKIHSQHNHNMTDRGYMKLLKVPEDVKQCFYEYFRNGVYGVHAKRLHELNLRKADFQDLDVASINPRMYFIRKMYHEWKQLNEDIKAVSKVKQKLKSDNILSDLTENGCGFIYVKEMISKMKPDDECDVEDSVFCKIADDILKDLERGDIKEEPMLDISSVNSEVSSVDSPPIQILNCGGNLNFVGNCKSPIKKETQDVKKIEIPVNTEQTMTKMLLFKIGPNAYQMIPAISYNPGVALSSYYIQNRASCVVINTARARI